MQFALADGMKGALTMVVWNSQRYDELPLPHVDWGRRVIERLQLRGDEVLIDAGCGTGRDAELALRLLPNGRVIGLDASPSMCASFADRFRDRDQVEVRQTDLTAEWPIPSDSIDAIMSVAALHWLPAPALFWAQVARVLRPGGRISIECGGTGNIAAVVAAARKHGCDSHLPNWYFGGVRETEQLLNAVGLEPISVGLDNDPAHFTSDEIYLDYLKHVVLHDFSDDQRAAIAATVGDRSVDYVRLQVTAMKPPNSRTS